MYTLALLADVPFSAGGFLKASFFGGLSGAVTFGIGTAVQSLPIAEKIVAGAFMHGTSQAVMTGIQGGDPLSAFVSGAVSSIAAGLWSTGGDAGKWQGFGGEWAKSDFGTIAFGTFAGGAGARLSGGNFWQGAVTGLMVAALNHAMHDKNGDSLLDESKQDNQEDPPAKKPSLEDLKKSPPNHPDYKAPKSGARRVNHPRGKGWIDKDGRTWIPDDHGGTHAPHWDVQPKQGPGYETKYPMSLVTPKNVAIGVGAAGTAYIVYKIVVGLATWECFGCGILLTP